MKKILFVFLGLLFMMPFCVYAQGVYKPVSLLIVENVIDVNGSTFDFNYNVDYPSKAVMNINNHGSGDVELHLVGEHSALFVDDATIWNVYAENIDVGSYGIRYADMGNRPTCSITLRGQTWFTEAGIGNADKFCICKKDRYGNYNWINIARDDSNTGYTC